MAFGDERSGSPLSGFATSIPDPAVCAGSCAVSVGDLVFAICGEQSNLTVVGCSDNLGNTYVAQNAGTDNGNRTGRCFYSRVTVAGTLTAVNFDVTASTDDWAGLAMVIEGPFPASPIDANPANITSDVTIPLTCPATGTLAQANEVIVAWASVNKNDVNAAVSPNILSGAANSGTNIRVLLGHQTVAVTTSVAPEFTGSGNPDDAILGTASFKKEEILGDTGGFFQVF